MGFFLIPPMNYFQLADLTRMVEQKFRWFVFGRYRAGFGSARQAYLLERLAFEAILNGVDQLGATAAGELMIQGCIPLMDKIGYVSRFA